MVSERQVRDIVAEGLNKLDLKDKRVLILIPDTTRTAPVGLLVKTIYRILNKRAVKTDLLVALGTHQPLSRTALLNHLDMTEEEYGRDYSNMALFNHQWNDFSRLMNIGTLPAKLIHDITGGLMEENVKITVNRMVSDYDYILIVGPVFPHEVAGFSGGSKYLFPGISGSQIIDFFHWLGAVITNMKIIGKADNPVRQVLDEAAKLLPIPVRAVSLVVDQGKLAGVCIGLLKDSWQKAVALSSKLHIVGKKRAFKRVLACAPLMYDDLWTGGKCMYKCEPVVADGGELIIYAPHIKSFSYTYGDIMEKIGYHVRDYYLQDIEKFKDIPRAAMAVSTYLRGTGTYEDGLEEPRIKVTLATGISRQICEKAGLGYISPGSIKFSEWLDREDEGILFVEKAGEKLFVLESN